jgi:hypothetical protein
MNAATFGPLSQINARMLDVGYVETGRLNVGLADGEAQYDKLEKRLAGLPVIAVPTVTLEGDANDAPHSGPTSYEKKFVGNYWHRTVSGGVGHNPPQEATQAFAEAVIEVDGFES